MTRVTTRAPYECPVVDCSRRLDQPHKIRDDKFAFFQKSIIVSLKSIFYRLSWRHYCSSTNAVLHVMSGRRVSGALILKLIVMWLENMFSCDFLWHCIHTWMLAVQVSVHSSSLPTRRCQLSAAEIAVHFCCSYFGETSPYVRFERLRRVELISKLCAVPSLELDSISMGDLTETLMFAVYRLRHFSK